MTPSGTGGSGVVRTDCVALRTETYDILNTNCAICHQAPGMAALYAGPFNFILDLQMLTTNISPASTPTVTFKYVVKGDPSHSYIYQRIMSNQMPPPNRTQRPSAGDLQTLNQWISNCIDDAESPDGWMGSGATPDGGMGGPMLEPCGTGNVCPNGGCCVFARCRDNGTTCGPLPNPIPGQADQPGFPGMCTNGSCQNTAGQTCGNVGQPCCAFNSCTATQATCLVTNLTMCSACGGTDQPCCNPANCLPGYQCVGNLVGGVGTCKMCGELGQPCCGSVSVSLQTCNNPAHMCVRDLTQESRCIDPNAPGTGGTSGGAGGAGGGAP